MGDETQDKLADAISLFNATMIANSEAKQIKNPFFMKETLIALLLPIGLIIGIYSDYKIAEDDIVELKSAVKLLEEKIDTNKNTVCSRMNIFDVSIDKIRDDVKDNTAEISRNNIQTIRRFIAHEKDHK